jgi:hypothetical protein
MTLRRRSHLFDHDAAVNRVAAPRHHGERQLAGIVLMIGVTNLFNRFNGTTRQIAGTDWQ